MKTRWQFVSGHVQDVCTMKPRVIESPRQASIVPTVCADAVNVVETPSLFGRVQVDMAASEDVERETPGIAATLASCTPTPCIV